MPRYDVPKFADYSGAIQANQSMANSFANLGNQSQDYLKMEEQKNQNAWNRVFEGNKLDFETNKYKNELQEKADKKEANATTMKALFPEQVKDIGLQYGQTPTIENANKMSSFLGNVDINNFARNQDFVNNNKKDQRDYEYKVGQDSIKNGFERDRIALERQRINKPQYEFKDTDKGLVAIDKNNPSGQPITILGGYKNPDQSKETFKQEKDLRDEYTKKASNYLDAKSNYARINASDESAVGDLSLIYAYMKMLDPQSVVREGEFATAQNAAGVDDRVRNTFNRIISGERLNKDQRDSFKKQAGDLYNTTIADEKKLRDTLSIVADYYKLDKKNIFGNDFVNNDNSNTAQPPNDKNQENIAQPSSNQQPNKKTWRDWQ